MYVYVQYFVMYICSLFCDIFFNLVKYRLWFMMYMYVCNIFCYECSLSCDIFYKLVIYCLWFVMYVYVCNIIWYFVMYVHYLVIYSISLKIYVCLRNSILHATSYGLTRRSVCQSCFFIIIFFIFSATSLKPLDKISWDFVVMKFILCSNRNFDIFTSAKQEWKY